MLSVYKQLNIYNTLICILSPHLSQPCCYKDALQSTDSGLCTAKQNEIS